MCIWYTVLLHREINRMKLIYTINEGKIFISPWEGNDEITKCVKVYNDCFPDLSFFHLKANIPHKITSLFSASPEKGIILSVQFLKKNTCLEFESRQCWKMNFYPSVVSIQLMLTSLPSSTDMRIQRILIVSIFFFHTITPFFYWIKNCSNNCRQRKYWIWVKKKMVYHRPRQINFLTIY